jgi:acyl-CoA synthetase (AMP-forming)/AMP-acid ligase II
VKEEGADNLGMLCMSGSMAIAPKTQGDFEMKARSILFDAHGFSETSGATLTPTTMDVLAPALGGRGTASKLFHLLDRILNVPGVIPLLRAVLTLIGRKNVGAIVNRLMPLLASFMPSPMDERRELIGSVGYPLVDEDFKAIDEDTGETIPIQKLVKEKLRGEMCVKGPNLMVGYWPDRGTGVDDEGYVHTGDVVKMDEAGRVSIVDRTKDMVNVSGYKVYTIEIDDLLYEYPGVYEAATIGVPDPERPRSERLKCFVAPLPEYKGKLKEEDIIEFLRGKVAKYAVPKSVEIRDELPKTVAEKIFKRKLREEEIEKMKKGGFEVK